MNNSGLAIHVHHNILFEFCYDYEGRLRVIEQDKPPKEQKLRKRLFQLVKSPLPAEVKMVVETVYQMREALGQVRGTYDQARRTYDQARGRSPHPGGGTLTQAEEALIQAEEAYAQAEEAYAQARKAYALALEVLALALAAHEEEMLAIHARECPNCPWDGKTIFPKGVRK